MRRIPFVVMAGVTLVLWAGSVGQAALLKMDLQSSDSSPDQQTQSGWTSWTIPAGPDSVSYAMMLNGITVTLNSDPVNGTQGWESRGGAGTGGNQNRQPVSGTSWNDMVQDFWGTRTGVATLQLAGLTTGLTYQLQVWDNDSFSIGDQNNHGWGGSGTVTPTITGATAGATTNGAITNLYGAQGDSAFGVTSISFVATGNNPLITLTSSTGLLPINGFTLSSVPEPSTLVLFGSGLLGLLAYAWRKRR